MEMISGAVVHFSRSHLLAVTVQRDGKPKDVAVTKDEGRRTLVSDESACGAHLYSLSRV
jgi:hypothetical protein